MKNYQDALILDVASLHVIKNETLDNLFCILIFCTVSGVFRLVLTI